MEASRNQVNGGRVRSSMDGGGGAGAGVGSEVTREKATQGAGTSVNPTRAAAARPPQADQGPRAGDIEKVWTHGTKLPGQGFICGYCGTTNRGGGATRLRDHLGGIVGEVKACNNVPRTVRDAMRELKKTMMDNKREKEQRKLRLEQDLMQGLHGDDEVINIASDDEEHVRMEIRKSLRDKNLSCAIERRGGGEKAVCVSVGKRSVTAYFDKDLASSKAPVQPRIDTALSKGSREQIGQAWSKWFQANDIGNWSCIQPLLCTSTTYKTHVTVNI